MTLIGSIAVRPAALTVLLLALRASVTAEEPATQSGQLRMLFIGNSFTDRGGMPNVVKELAEAGNPGLRFEHISHGRAGMSIEGHWQGGVPQQLIALVGMPLEEREKTLQSFRDAFGNDPDNAIARRVLRYVGKLKPLGAEPRKWDFVSLQKYEKTDGYVEYARKFAEMIKAQDGRPLLFLTATGSMINAKPLAESPGPEVVWADANVLAEFANRIDAAVVPMPAVALHCNRVRPDLALRFVNDNHPNQTMAYLTACTFYAALFERSPQGLPVDKATDFKAFAAGKDADGDPLARTFSPRDRADLQRIAWEGYCEFQKLRKELMAEKQQESER